MYEIICLHVHDDTVMSIEDAVKWICLQRSGSQLWRLFKSYNARLIVLGSKITCQYFVVIEFPGAINIVKLDFNI